MKRIAFLLPLCFWSLAPSLVGVAVGQALTYRDEFNFSGGCQNPGWYQGNDGAQSFADRWQEGGDETDNSPCAGNVQVALNGSDGELRMRNDPRTVERTADLSNTTSAQLTFDYRSGGGVETTDEIDVHVCTSPTGTCTLLTTLAPTTNGQNISGTYTTPITANRRTATTTVRFTVTSGGSAGGWNGSDEFFFVDNFEISAAGSATATPTNVSTSTPTITPGGPTLTPTPTATRNPSALPLDKTMGMVRCTTCHDTHAGAGAGMLLRDGDVNALCTQCHTLADVAAGAHADAASGALWPGGQYGSTFPAITDASQRGYCSNCHRAHGWPDASAPTPLPTPGNTATDYPKLLAEFEENLCFTCHDTDGPANKAVKDDFAKARHHPVVDAEQAAGRSVECTDCHNPHQARTGSHSYGSTATAARHQVSNPTRNVSGVSVTFPAGNFVAPSLGDYTAVSAATDEYEICFKCHTGYSWLPGSPPNGLSPNGSASTPVETDLAQEFSPNNRSGHPVVTGLDNYPNSIAVGSPARKGLQPAALKAPWNTNVGTQTMMCSDCHTTDAASPAAQGPHGSAAQFMLRGPNAANWPNVTLQNFNTSWCANCHNNSAGDPHNKGDHQSRPCYACHIVIPHGGKLSRLLADNDTMPARYGYNNTRNTQYLRAFTKRATNSYSKSDCRAQCAGDHDNQNPSENW